MNCKILLYSIVLYGVCFSLTRSNPITKNVSSCQDEEIDPNGGLFQHESSCRHFYQCAHGQAMLMECPEGLEFNPIKKECDWPGESGCNLAFGKEETPCVNYPEPTCPPHQANKPAVHLPDPKDCRKFYECDWEVPYVKECPEGLHFNANLQVCDYPEKAKCACAQLQP